MRPRRRPEDRRIPQPQDRINENIRSINDLMKENKEKMASLQKKLKSSNTKVAGLEKMLAKLSKADRTKAEKEAEDWRSRAQVGIQ